MSRKSLILFGLVFVALVAAPAGAQEQEVIYFTNGTTMTVESHSIEDGMVQVGLGGQSFLAFPLEKVERIETATGEVAIPRETSNRMVPSPQHAGIVRGEVPGYKRRGQWEGPVNAGSAQSVDVDEKGMTVFRPFPVDAPAHKRQFGVTGRRELRNMNPSRSSSDGVIGTAPLGTRYVLPSKTPGTGNQKRQPVALQMGSSSKSKRSNNNNSGNDSSNNDNDNDNE